MLHTKRNFELLLSLLLSHVFLSTSSLELMLTPNHPVFKIQAASFSLLCAMFLVRRFICTECNEFFPCIVSRRCLSRLPTVSMTLVIIGTTKHFIFHIRLISTHRLWYFFCRSPSLLHSLPMVLLCLSVRKSYLSCVSFYVLIMCHNSCLHSTVLSHLHVQEPT
jgi:hypothetical protein